MNVSMPCNGDIYFPIWDDWPSWKSCDYCARHHEAQEDAADLVPDGFVGGNCLGEDGWPFMALAAAEVAQERGQALGLPAGQTYPYPVTLGPGATR